MDKYLTPMGPTKLHVNPIFEIGPLEPRFSEWLVFEGVSVDEQGAALGPDAMLVSSYQSCQTPSCACCMTTAAFHPSNWPVCT